MFRSSDCFDSAVDLERVTMKNKSVLLCISSQYGRERAGEGDGKEVELVTTRARTRVLLEALSGKNELQIQLQASVCIFSRYGQLCRSRFELDSRQKEDSKLVHLKLARLLQLPFPSLSLLARDPG